jgi:pimeloyl-ACP methyl ester carboxylesterase
MRCMITTCMIKSLAVVSIATAIAALNLFSAATPSQASDTISRPSFAVKVVGHGAPVILMPGLSCSGAVWDGTVEHLKDHYECHVLTLAGFAGQPRIEAPFLETVRKDLATYIRHEKLNHPIIIGHSLGGFLALWLASNDADLTGPLVIVDAVPFLPAIFDPSATVETMKPRAEQTRTAVYSAMSVRTMVTKPADIDLVMSWVKTTDPVAAGNAMFDVFTHDLRGELAAIKSPTLVFGTWIAFKDYSTRADVEAGIRKQFTRLKNGKFVMADNARHFIMLDDPQWFYEQVDAFLAGLDDK